MAYPNYYYPTGYQPMMQQPQQTNTLLWVQGEVGAKSYPVAPNNTVLLMDSESEAFYLKSCDASGMPTLRIFDYKERPKAENTLNVNRSINTSTEYVTKSEFDDFKHEIQDIIGYQKVESNE